MTDETITLDCGTVLHFDERHTHLPKDWWRMLAAESEARIMAEKSMCNETSRRIPFIIIGLSIGFGIGVTLIKSVLAYAVARPGAHGTTL